MITYVNTVLVSNLATGAVLAAAPAAATSLDTPSADAGKFVFMNCDNEAKGAYDISASNVIKIGVVTKQNTAKVDYSTGAVTYEPIVKWSNEIKKGSVKHYALTNNADHADAPEKVELDFSALSAGLLAKFAEGGKRVVVRLTYKDMPTRFRKWTDSYEYITKDGETLVTLVDGIASMINKEYKRARVTAVSDHTNKVTITAMEYDDDNSAESINLAGKVRFSVNVYYTDPQAAGFASHNKYPLAGAKVKHTAGVQNPVGSKLVRDHESLSMGYLGVLNRGEGTWPVIKPSVETQLDQKYDGITLEFENEYNTADDLKRKTKQTVEIYGLTGQLTAVDTALKAFVG